MAAIPWTAIFNLLVSVTLFVIERMKEKEKLRIEFLDFISKVQKKDLVNVNIHRRYKDYLNERDRN